MKTLLIAFLIAYFIGIYPSYYLWKNIISSTLLQMVDEDLLDEDKKTFLISVCRKISIKIALTPMINTISLLLFACVPMNAIQRYIFLRLKAMDVDTMVKDMLDDEEE